jgi:hypothetical protein
MKNQKITDIGRSEIRVLSSALLEEAQMIAKQYGLTVKLGRGVYGHSNCRITLEFATVNDDGVAQTAEWTDLVQMSRMLGLTEADLTKPFRQGNRTFVLAGYRSRASAKPFLVRDTANDKIYIMREATVLAALGKGPKPLASHSRTNGSTWCTCKTPGDPVFHPDNGSDKHHYTCSKCGGTMQVG